MSCDESVTVEIPRIEADALMEAYGEGLLAWTKPTPMINWTPLDEFMDRLSKACRP